MTTAAWGRMGKPRQLHIEKALDVTRLSPLTRKPGPEGQPEQVEGAVRTLLGSSAYFTAYRLEADGSVSFEAGGESFHSLLVLQGEGTLAWNGGSRAIQKETVFSCRPGWAFTGWKAGLPPSRAWCEERGRVCRIKTSFSKSIILKSAGRAASPFWNGCRKRTFHRACQQ